MRSVPVLESQPASELPPPPTACLALCASSHESALWSLHKSLLLKCNNGCRCALESRVDTQQPRTLHDTLIRQPPHHRHRFSSALSLASSLLRTTSIVSCCTPLLPDRLTNVPRVKSKSRASPQHASTPQTPAEDGISCLLTSNKSHKIEQSQRRHRISGQSPGIAQAGTH